MIHVSSFTNYKALYLQSKGNIKNTSIFIWYKIDTGA